MRILLYPIMALIVCGAPVYMSAAITIKALRLVFGS